MVETSPPVLVFDQDGSAISVDRDAVAACTSASQLMDVVSRYTLHSRRRCFQVLRLSRGEAAQYVQFRAATPTSQERSGMSASPNAARSPPAPPRARASAADSDARHGHLVGEGLVRCADGDVAALTVARATSETSPVSHGNAPAPSLSRSPQPVLDGEDRKDAAAVVAATAAEGAGCVWSCTPLGKIPLPALRPLREWPPRSSEAPQPRHVYGAQPLPVSTPSCAQVTPVTDMNVCPSTDCSSQAESDSDFAVHLAAGAVVLYALTSPVLAEESPVADAASLPASAQGSADSGTCICSLTGSSRPTAAAKQASPLAAATTTLHNDLAVSLAAPLAVSSIPENTSSDFPLSSYRTSTGAACNAAACTAAAVAAAANPLSAASPPIEHLTAVEQPDLCVVRPRMPFPAQAGKLLEVGCAYGVSRFARGRAAQPSATVGSASSVVSSTAPGMTASSVTGSVAPSSRLNGSTCAATTTTSTTATRRSSVSSVRPRMPRCGPQSPPLVPRCAATALNPVICTAPHHKEAPPVSTSAAAAQSSAKTSCGRLCGPCVCRNPVPPLSKSTISLAIALHINSNYAFVRCLLRHYIAFEVESIVEALRCEHPFLRCPAAQAYVTKSAELLAGTEARGRGSGAGGGGSSSHGNTSSNAQPPDAGVAPTSNSATAARAAAADTAQRSFTLYRQYFTYLRSRIESGTVSLSQAIRNVEAAVRQVAVTSDNPLRVAVTPAATETVAESDAPVDLASPEALREVYKWLAMTPQTGVIKSVLERHLSGEDRLRCEQVQRVRDAVTARTSARAAANLRAAHIAYVLRGACDDEQLAADALVHVVRNQSGEAPVRQATKGHDATIITVLNGSANAVAAGDTAEQLAAAFATVQQRSHEVEWFSGIEHAVGLRLLQPSRLLDIVECLWRDPNAVVDLWYNSDGTSLHTLRLTLQWLNKRLGH